jgi:DNA-binding transcriptional LysR family regulator
MIPAALLGFFHIANEGSITAAASLMGVSKSILSLQLTQLEKGADVRLFQRSTRKMQLTDAGQQLFVHARQLKQTLHEAKLGIENYSKKISGKITIAGAKKRGICRS